MHARSPIKDFNTGSLGSMGILAPWNSCQRFGESSTIQIPGWSPEFPVETLSKPRRRQQLGHVKTKDLIGRTIAQHVRFKTLYIFSRPTQNNNVK